MSDMRRQILRYGTMTLFVVDGGPEVGGAPVSRYELEVDGQGVVATFLSLEEASIYLELMAEDDAAGPMSGPTAFKPPPCFGRCS